MKIFAKRKRQATPVPKKEITFQSDPIVEQLLKQDESTWNAKQRRMIKRYKDRKDEETKDEKETVKDAPNEKDSVEKGTSDKTVPSESKSKEDDSGSSDDSSESDSDDDNSTNNDTASTDQPRDSATTSEDSAPEPDQSNKTGTVAVDTEPSTAISAAPEIDDKLQKLLDGLNSKQRRTLMRQLERGGDLETIRAEAMKLTPGGTASGEAAATKVSTSSSKKRKVDWSTLPAEERLRREEQRRLQQEAQLARASTTSLSSKTHKHPLNSERRRANRRKPKWDRGSMKDRYPPNEHDSSGYHMRKITGAGGSR